VFFRHIGSFCRSESLGQIHILHFTHLLRNWIPQKVFQWNTFRIEILGFSKSAYNWYSKCSQPLWNKWCLLLLKGSSPARKIVMIWWLFIAFVTVSTWLRRRSSSSMCLDSKSSHSRESIRPSWRNIPQSKSTWISMVRHSLQDHSSGMSSILWNLKSATESLMRHSRPAVLTLILIPQRWFLYLMRFSAKSKEQPSYRVSVSFDLREEDWQSPSPLQIECHSHCLKEMRSSLSWCC